VAADDVAQLVVLSLRDGSLRDKTIDIGGPENLTPMDVVRLDDRASGRRAKVVRVPLGLVRAMSYLARPLHPGLSQVLQAAVVAESSNQQFDARSFAARFPITLTRLEEWIRNA
jgi:uncharacterized protein YbjT (DUF2867 family)